MRGEKINKTIVLAVLLGLLLAACTPGASGHELAGTNWQLVSIDGNAQVGEAIGGQPVTISFESNGQVGGSGGCNSYGGSYEANASAGAITFSEIVSTLMACMDNGIMEVEASYFAALNAATRYEITECEACANPETLTVTGGGHTLVFASA
ncbi:MAG: META domain-containing protein [Anaerolineales bacterium]